MAVCFLECGVVELVLLGVRQASHLEVIVGKNCELSVVVRMSARLAGGSSSNLSSACWAGRLSF